MPNSQHLVKNIDKHKSRLVASSSFILKGLTGCGCVLYLTVERKTQVRLVWSRNIRGSARPSLRVCLKLFDSWTPHRQTPGGFYPKGEFLFDLSQFFNQTKAVLTEIFLLNIPKFRLLSPWGVTSRIFSVYIKIMKDVLTKILLYFLFLARFFYFVLFVIIFSLFPCLHVFKCSSWFYSPVAASSLSLCLLFISLSPLGKDWIYFALLMFCYAIQLFGDRCCVSAEAARFGSYLWHLFF